MKNRYFIGIASTFHEPAVAIVNQDGEVLFAQATERHTQYKRAMNCNPDTSSWAKYLLQTYCPDPEEVVIATTWNRRFLRRMSWKSILGIFGIEHFLLKKFLRTVPSHISPIYQSTWVQKGLLSSNHHAGIGFVKTLNELYPKAKIKFRRYDHHLTHAALACYGSPYEEGTCAIIDGSGEKGSYTYYSYENNTITRLKEQRGVASLGYFYIMLTLLCGFDPDKGEQWKVMGLAPYGKRNDRAYYLLKSLYNLDSKGFRMNVMKWPALLKELFTFSRKENASPLSAADLAYTGQIVFSEWIDLLLKDAHKRGNSDNLIYSGGCALNSAYNGLITERTPFQSLYVPSAPGDDGNALGAALMSYYQAYPAQESKHKNMSPYLGSEFTSRRMENFLKFSQLDNIEHLPNGNMYEAAAKLLSEGKIIGWVQGKAEFGPRALGNRSILADPRYPGMKEKINARVKFREAFRPFAPSILDEYGDTYFENYQPSPYMERTLVFRESVRDNIPAVVHQNGTGRLQSVSLESNPRYYHLIKAFHRITGVPVLLNTSFNVMGKPIIHSIEDAISVFYTTGLDALIIGDYLILKQEEDVKMVEDVLEMA